MESVSRKAGENSNATAPNLSMGRDAKKVWQKKPFSPCCGCTVYKHIQYICNELIIKDTMLLSQLQPFAKEVYVGVVNVCLLQVPHFTSANAGNHFSPQTAKPVRIFLHPNQTEPCLPLLQVYTVYYLSLKFQCASLIHAGMGEDASKTVMTLTASALKGTVDVSAMLVNITLYIIDFFSIRCLSYRC